MNTSIRLTFRSSLTQLRLAKLHGVAVERQRFWACIARSNGTFRPDQLLTREDELTRAMSDIRSESTHSPRMLMSCVARRTSFATYLLAR